MPAWARPIIARWRRERRLYSCAMRTKTQRPNSETSELNCERVGAVPCAVSRGQIRDSGKSRDRDTRVNETRTFYCIEQATTTTGIGSTPPRGSGASDFVKKSFPISIL